MTEPVFQFEPQAASTKPIKLVHPYFSSHGENFDYIYMYYESPKLNSGAVLGTDKRNTIRVLDTFNIEDFFENIEVAVCVLVTNSPTDIFDITARKIDYMYSTYKEY